MSEPCSVIGCPGLVSLKLSSALTLRRSLSSSSLSAWAPGISIWLGYMCSMSVRCPLGQTGSEFKDSGQRGKLMECFETKDDYSTIGALCTWMCNTITTTTITMCTVLMNHWMHNQTDKSQRVGKE